MTREVLTLRHEGGKSITAKASHGGRVALIVWRKNGAPLLPLALALDEAEALCTLLRAAMKGTAP